MPRVVTSEIASFAQAPRPEASMIHKGTQDLDKFSKVLGAIGGVSDIVGSPLVGALSSAAVDKYDSYQKDSARAAKEQELLSKTQAEYDARAKSIAAGASTSVDTPALSPAPDTSSSEDMRKATVEPKKEYAPGMTDLLANLAKARKQVEGELAAVPAGNTAKVAEKKEQLDYLDKWSARVKPEDKYPQPQTPEMRELDAEDRRIMQELSRDNLPASQRAELVKVQQAIRDRVAELWVSEPRVTLDAVPPARREHMAAESAIPHTIPSIDPSAPNGAGSALPTPRKTITSLTESVAPPTQVQPRGDSVPHMHDDTEGAAPVSLDNISDDEVLARVNAAVKSGNKQEIARLEKETKDRIAFASTKAGTKHSPVSAATAGLAQQTGQRGEEARREMDETIAHMKNALVAAGVSGAEAQAKAEGLVAQAYAKQAADNKKFMDATDRFVQKEPQVRINDSGKAEIVPGSGGEQVSLRSLAEIAKLADTKEKQARVFELLNTVNLPAQSIYDRFDPNRYTKIAQEYAKLFPAPKKSLLEESADTAFKFAKTGQAYADIAKGARTSAVQAAGKELQAADKKQDIAEGQSKLSLALDRLEEAKRAAQARDAAIQRAAALGNQGKKADIAEKGDKPELVALKSEYDIAESTAKENAKQAKQPLVNIDREKPFDEPTKPAEVEANNKWAEQKAKNADIQKARDDQKSLNDDLKLKHKAYTDKLREQGAKIKNVTEPPVKGTPGKSADKGHVPSAAEASGYE
ncbi:hypothetical protein UFOVP777_15 [uncultured Caudovirales phage]|uniref:Uncharacterized protein n=1 Tax=uncultured Caudovirales phage TaxID=2100421 RepID=A0A6J5NRJ3_9CAUD|nr:hypothetical protein UFOVP777_15 [uncultured Caudovirales phage]